MKFVALVSIAAMIAVAAAERAIRLPDGVHCDVGEDFNYDSRACFCTGKGKTALCGSKGSYESEIQRLWPSWTRPSEYWPWPSETRPSFVPSDIWKWFYPSTRQPSMTILYRKECNPGTYTWQSCKLCVCNSDGMAYTCTMRQCQSNEQKILIPIQQNPQSQIIVPVNPAIRVVAPQTPTFMMAQSQPAKQVQIVTPTPTQAAQASTQAAQASTQAPAAAK